MNKEEFSEVLRWFMCSDPFQEHLDHELIEAWLDREAQDRGYQDWLDAYHQT